MNAGGRWRSSGEKVVSLLGSPLIFGDRKSDLGLGMEKGGDEIGSFRTTAEFLLVTHKPLMIPGLTGYP